MTNELTIIAAASINNVIGNNNSRATGLQKTIKLLNPLNYLLQFKLTGTLSEQHLQLFYSSDNIFGR